MKQRVMIAQALACDPDLLIADEPTTSLDVTIQARILDLIAELQDRHHASVLYISHDLAVVRSVSDRVAVMYAGQLVEIGPTARMLSEPSHPYTRGLLAARPQGTPGAGRAAGHRRDRARTGRSPAVLPLSSPLPPCRSPSAGGRSPPCSELDSADHQVACFLYDDAARRRGARSPTCR